MFNNILMAIDTTTLNYIIDAENNFLMKLFFFLIVSVYTIFLIYWLNKKDYDNLVMYFILRIVQGWGIAWFTFIPMYIGVFYRTVDFEFMYYMLITAYGLVFSMIPILFLVGYGEVILRWVLKPFTRDSYIRFRRDKNEKSL